MQDYKVGDMVVYSHIHPNGSMVIGIVVSSISPLHYWKPVPSQSWFPAYVIMEPGGRKSVVSHKRMKLVK